MTVKKSMQELERADVDTFRRADKFPLVLILDQVRSGLNVGSLFRTADAFAIKKIVCVGYTPCPPHREVLKTALGSAQSVEWHQVENIQEEISSLRSKGYQIMALEQVHNSMPLQEWSAPRVPTALIVGNEVSGVSDEALAWCDGFLEITQYGTKHSLNVAVSGGMAIYHIIQQWSAASLKS